MSTPLSKPCIECNVQPTLPDASKYTWIYDSTDPRNLGDTALGKTDAVRTVGPCRGEAKNKRIMLTAGATTQSATLVRYRLTGAGAWALYASTTLTAGDTPQGLTWDVVSPDALIGILAGGTAPSAICVTLLVKEQP
jgi:hypothetical protein